MKASKAKNRQLTDILEKLYAKYNRRELISPDPLQFVYKYSEPADMEIVGFLASALAYGTVQQIEKSLANLFERMGRRPSEFVRSFDRKRRALLESFKHRFTAGGDIADLLTLFKSVLNRHGSIEKFFIRGYEASDKNIIPALSGFCESLLDMYARKHSGRVTRGLAYLLTDPAAGSACKRLNLFLRWMVRSDDVDVGLWKSVDKAKLIVPVDVHMGRLCRILRLYDRKTVSLAAAVEITRSFAQIDPADPVKYDFALSRVGIVDNCTGRLRPECELCQLFAVCFGR
ncbi:MAG: TIGR02757 family protein [Planctomycetota bacterium]